MEKSYKVFYIEDNVHNRMLVERFLEFEGFEVLSAETGHEGLNRANDIMPDVFLVDLNLPDISGYEVIHALNRRQETQRIPKVAFSADSAQRARQRLQVGPVFFMHKPVDVETLADKIKFAIQYPDDRQTFVL